MFIVYALPRSRSFWLSKFLSYGEWTCGHDEMRHARSLDDVAAFFRQPGIGTVETAAAPWWRLVQELCPAIRTVVLRRPVGEIIESLRHKAPWWNSAAIEKRCAALNHKLDQIVARVPDVLSITSAELDNRETCAAVFDHCLGVAFDPEWWRQVRRLNLQADLQAITKYVEAFRPQMDRLAGIARQHVISRMRPEPVAIDGMTIQQEAFRQFYIDGQSLFREHLVFVGEPPDAFATKNIPLMEKLDDAGALQVMTARSNGRMFGYLMTVISPSLESPEVTCAYHTTFFASPDVPGLGIRLQKAAIGALRGKRVDELYLRAGPRGDGPRMGPLYRRLGADRAGEIYMMKLKEAA